MICSLFSVVANKLDNLSEPLTKQMEVKANRTLFSRRNLTGHHLTKQKTQRQTNVQNERNNEVEIMCSRGMVRGSCATLAIVILNHFISHEKGQKDVWWLHCGSKGTNPWLSMTQIFQPLCIPLHANNNWHFYQCLYEDYKWNELSPYCHQ